MENQKNGIFYPELIEVFFSNDGTNFKKVGAIKRSFISNTKAELKEFKLLGNKQTARYVKVKISLPKNTETNKEGWLFLDEILID